MLVEKRVCDKCGRVIGEQTSSSRSMAGPIQINATEISCNNTVLNKSEDLEQTPVRYDFCHEMCLTEWLRNTRNNMHPQGETADAA